MFKFYFLIIILLLTSFYGIGQSAVKDSTYHYPDHEEMINNFNNAIGLQSRLFNGTKYTGYDRVIKGNANFMDLNAPVTGTVRYEGYVYANIPLMYDLNRDQVVTVMPDHFSTFSLLSQEVGWFIIKGHTFINIKADTLADKLELKTGFYEVLYAGRISVLAKRDKAIQKSSSLQTLESYFTASDNYWVEKDKHYHVVSGQSSFLKVLQDHKKELQRYIKDNKIKFGKNTEHAMAILANYYDSLLNNNG